MKLKSLYVYFAALVVVIIISIRITTESAKIPAQPQKEEKIIPQQGVVFGQSRYSRRDRPAITVTKRPAPKEKIIPQAQEEETKLKTREMEKASERQRREIADSQEAAAATTAGAASGITKINKYPTKEESEEMNERGILMY